MFICNHCPTAQAYEDLLIELANVYSGKGVQVVAISPNDPLSIRLDELGYTDLSDSYYDMVQRATEKKFNFLYLYDGKNQDVSKKYGLVADMKKRIVDNPLIGWVY